MLPNSALSSQQILGEYLIPDNKKYYPLHDYELGGVGLNDPTQGLQYQVWECFLDGNTVKVTAPNTSPTTVLTDTGITSLTFTFDQNMRPFVSYIASGVAKYWWYDTQTSQQTTTILTGATSISATLDDKRKNQSGTSDIILAYVKNNNLYFLAQRDRYLVERLLKTGINAVLIKAGMTNKGRVQFKLLPI